MGRCRHHHIDVGDTSFSLIQCDLPHIFSLGIRRPMEPAFGNGAFFKTGHKMDVHGATDTVRIVNPRNAGADSFKQVEKFSEAVERSTTSNSGSQPSGSSNSHHIIFPPRINFVHPTGKQGAPQSSENTGESSIKKRLESASEHPATKAVLKVAPKVAKAMAEKSGGGILASIKGALGTISKSTLGGAFSKIGGVLIDLERGLLKPETFKGFESFKQLDDFNKSSHNWKDSYGDHPNNRKALDTLLNHPEDY